MRYRLLIRARRKPSETYMYVATRQDDPAWSEIGEEEYQTLDEAAHAGRLAIHRLERTSQSAAEQNPFYHQRTSTWCNFFKPYGLVLPSLDGNGTTVARIVIIGCCACSHALLIGRFASSPQLP